MFNLDYCGFLLCVLTLIGVQWHLPPSSICQSECWVVFLSRGEGSFGANCWIRWEIVVAPGGDKSHGSLGHHTIQYHTIPYHTIP